MQRSEGGGSFQAVDTLNGKLLCGCDDVHACEVKQLTSILLSITYKQTTINLTSTTNFHSLFSAWINFTSLFSIIEGRTRGNDSDIRLLSIFSHLILNHYCLQL